jgi:phage/plasmid-associated DNA primase
MSSGPTSLSQLLRRYGTEGLPTHRLLDNGHPYCVDPAYRQDFWKGYCDLLQAPSKVVHHLAEEPSTDMPLVLFLDLKFFYRNLMDEQPVPEEFHEVATCCIRETLLSTLPITEDHLYCIICQTPGWKEEDKFCITIRYHFPYIKVNANWQSSIFVPRVVDAWRKDRLFDQLGSNSVYSINQSVRTSSTTSPLVVFGSAEKGCPVAELISVYNGSGQDIELDQFFDIGQHQYSKTFVFEEHTFDDYSTRELLPLFMSVHFCTTSIVPTERIEIEDQANFVMRDAEPGVEEALFFLSLLKKDRITEDYSWKDIGRVLINLYHGTTEGLEVWQDFSRGIRTALDCEKVWKDMVRTRKRNMIFKHMSVKTLAWYAFHDNPEKYKKWHKQWVACSIQRAALAPREQIRVAEAVYRCFWLEFISVIDNSKVRWYHFRRHTWCITPDGLTLSRKIDKEFKLKLESYRSYLSKEIMKASEEQKEKLEKFLDGVSVLISNLGVIKYRSDVMRACKDSFAPEDFNFEKIADTNPFLMGMENGVHEICGKLTFFRPGKPEDFIKMSTHIDYKDYDQLSETGNGYDHPEVKDVLNYFEKVLPIEAVREWLLYDFASCLKARNARKLLRCLEGKKGNNSKSKLIMLLQNALGDYCSDGKASMLTDRPAKANEADPQLVEIDLSHIVVIHETEDELCFRAGIIKRLTGGDRLSGRNLYEPGQRAFNMFWNLYVVCNTVAPIPAVDEAVTNRLVIVPFIAEFMSKDKLALHEAQGTRTPYMFLKDNDFEEIIPDMAEAFFWILSKNYTQSQIDSKPPEEISAATTSYWKDSDPCRMFIESHIARAIIVSEDGKEKIDHTATLSFTKLNERFKPFFSSNFPTREKLDTRRLKDNFIRLLGDQNNRQQWTGWRLIGFDENI